MQITEKAWVEYITKMSQISQKAADLMQSWVQKNGLENDKALLDYAYALSQHYGQAIGALSCQMYEATAAVQGVIVPTAEVADLPDYGEVAKAVKGTKKQSPNNIPGTLARLVKQVGADTTLKNAERDGAQFAWVPHGDTCAFCITLASRGWQYMSKKAMRNGHADTFMHIAIVSMRSGLMEKAQWQAMIRINTWKNITMPTGISMKCGESDMHRIKM